MVLPVGDVDVAVLIEGNAQGLVELARTLAGAAAFTDEFALEGEDLQAIVTAVDDDDVAVLFDGNASGAQQFTVAAAGCTPFLDEFPAAVEHRDRIGPFIRAVNPVSLVVDGDAERPCRIPVPFAVFEEVGEMFLFTGTAELHFVDMHPEIVLVPAIGGVEDSIFSKAHGLDVIEPGASGCPTPDGVAPVLNPTASNCCQRHRSLLRPSTVALPGSGSRFLINFCRDLRPAAAVRT